MEVNLRRSSEYKEITYPYHVYMLTRFSNTDTGGIPTTINILSRKWEGKTKSVQILRGGEDKVDLNQIPSSDMTIILHHLDINSIATFINLDEDHKRRCRIFLYQNIDKGSILRNSRLKAGRELSSESLSLIDKGVQARRWVCTYPGVQVYGISHDIIQNSIQGQMVDPERIHRIHLPIPELFYNRVDIEDITAKAEDKSMKILCVSRIEPEKGILDLFDLQRGISKNNTQETVIYVVGQASDSEFDRYVTRTAEKSNRELSCKVIFLGHMSHSELTDIYFDSTILVSPSKIDTWGLTLIEGMAHGLPIYYLPAPRSTEIFRGQVDNLGSLVTNMEEMSQRINKLFYDKERYITVLMCLSNSEHL